MAEHDPNGPAKPRLWCAGLPFVSREKLGRDDRQYLAALARPLRRQVALSMLSIPALPSTVAVLFCGPFYFCSGSCSLPPALSVVLVIAATFGIPTAFAAGILLFRDSSEPAVELRKDLQDSEVLVFEGELSPWWKAGDPTFDELSRRGLLQDGGQQRVEIFPRSRRIFRVNVTRVDRSMLPALVVEAPSVPSTIQSATRDVQPWPLPGFPIPVQSVDRPLTSAELKELDHVIYGCFQKDVPAFVVICGFFIISGYGASEMLAKGELFGGFWLVTSIAICGALAARLRRGYAIASEFALDKSGGIVVLARFPTMNGRAPGLSPPIEILPNSRLIWTYDSNPPDWRTRVADTSKQTSDERRGS